MDSMKTMSLTKQADFTRMSFPRGPGVCSFRISNWTVRPSQALRNPWSHLSPHSHPTSHVTRVPDVASLPPPLIPSQGFLSPPSLSLVSLFHLNTAPAPSFLPHSTSSCLMALTCGLEAPGNQKSFKELELRKGFLV